ncbi:metallophosphoesterase [Ornithinibacillus salinisoli]|uniref:Metallophosphoesterase n=1 Tax=Ornithinibacillus salinisoli TaxID=1848459 RepID=A0ABW4W2D5_9BACI
MIYIFLIIIMVFSIFYMIYRAHHDHVDYRSINDSRLPDSFNDLTIFFIADIHRRTIRQETLNSIGSHIDFVYIGGDLTEKGVPLAKTRENIKRLKQWGRPIYFVTGNNDYEVNINELSKLLLDEGITILNNSTIYIEKEKHVLCLTGLEYNPLDEPNDAIISENVQGDYRILLTHCPSDFYDLDITSQDKVHMVLAGHTHGGQIRIGRMGLYSKGGLRKVRNTHVFITEGYGYTLLPFRFGTSAECHVITWHSEKDTYNKDA